MAIPEPILAGLSHLPIVGPFIGSFFSLAPWERTKLYGANRGNPNTIPEWDRIATAWLRGDISDRAAALLSADQGIAFPAHDAYGSIRPSGGAWWPGAPDDATWRMYAEMWEGVAKQQIQVPQTGELIELLNRGIINLDDFRAALTKNNVVDQKWQDAYYLLRQQMPGISDLVTFAVREAWDQPTVDRFQYDAEFPEEFRFWAAKQGYDWDARMAGPDGRPIGPPGFTWPKAWWRVHWQIPSPQQAYEMYQRLRPGRTEPLLPGGAPVRPFTLEDLRTILKVHDYPVPFRDQLAAISFAKPYKRDVDAYFRENVIPAAEAMELYRDLGYSPRLARLRIDFLSIQKAKAKSPSRLFARVRKAVLDAYRIGATTKDAARAQLVELSTREHADRAGLFPPPPLPALDQVQAENRANTELGLIDAEATLEAAENLFKSIQKRFLRGMVSADDARRLLTRGGFDGARVNSFIAQWQVQLDGPRMIFSTQKIQALASKGLLPLTKAQLWLSNLGWTPEAIGYMLAEVQRDLALAQARALEKVAKSDKDKRRALQLQLQAQKKGIRDTERAFAKGQSPAALKRWFVKGVVSEARMRIAMQQQGNSADVINEWILEARRDRQAALDKANAAAAKKAAPKKGATNATGTQT